MKAMLFAALFALALTPLAARAEVASASDSAVTWAFEAETTASPADAQRALSQVGRWWSAAHTYSGNARNLSLDLRAGGCWCERWSGQSVEHMRVIAVLQQDGVRTIRLSGGLGPLQAMNVAGTMTFTLTPQASGTKIALTYRVSRDPSSGLGQVAEPVNQVLGEQFGRLVRYSNGAAPD